MANVVPVNPVIITWAREYHGITREELATKARVHVNQIDKWEDGKTRPTFNQAKKLATVFKSAVRILVP